MQPPCLGILGTQNQQIVKSNKEGNPATREIQYIAKTRILRNPAQGESPERMRASKQ